MKTKSQATAYIFGLMLIAPSALADIEDGLESMFMTTGNEPAIYQSQRRMGIDMGRLRLRAPINQVNVVNLSPPALRSGCGGIDMYGGSFTFINAEQFRQTLRQIGANALGYAFKLALKTMCEPCDSIITGLQNLSHELNKMHMNTCKWAAGIVNNTADALQFKVDEESKIEGPDSGLFADSFEATRALFENYGDSISGGDPSGADPNNPDVGNLTWNAIRAAGAGGTFVFAPGGGLSHEEMLLNIAGTVILRAPTGAEAGEEPIARAVSSRLSYQELKNGKTQDAGGADDVLPPLDCGADQAQCLNPDNGANWSFPGVNTWVNDRLTDAANLMADPATAANDHAADLQNFLGTLPIAVMRHMQLLQGDQAALDVYVDHIDEYIASAYASYFALELVRIIRAAYDRSDAPEMWTTVERSLDQFERDAIADQRDVNRKYAEIWLGTEELVATLTQHYGNPGSLISPRD